MRIGIPTLGEKGLEEELSPHFGRAPTFTIYDTESEEMEVKDNRSEHMGGKGKPPEQLDKNDIDVLVTTNLGRKAVAMFDKQGINVYCGASGTVQDAIEMWESDELEPASRKNACSGHGSR